MRNQIIRYWGRKSYELAYKYINCYSKPGEIVADIFGGSGIFVETALRLERRAVYVDLNPFAELIAHSLIIGCNISKYQQAVQNILERKNIQVKVKGKRTTLEPRKLFYIRCTCNRNVEAKSIIFTRVYCDKFTNFTKLHGIRNEIFQTIREKGQITHEELQRIHKNISTRSLSYIIKQLVKQGTISEKEIPITAYLLKPCKCGREKVNFKDENIWTIKSPIESYYWYPKASLEYESGKAFLKRRDVSRINEFFLDRSLALLSAIWNDICLYKIDNNTKRCLKLTFMATLVRSSKMCRKSGGTWPVNSYWIPRNFVIRNPYIVFRKVANQMINFHKSKRKLKCGKLKDVLTGYADVAFLLTDSTRLKMPKNSIDYIIIDPPHTDEAQFFELSLFYTSWLKKRLSFKNELIVNPKQQKTLDTYMQMLKEAAKSIYHILKPNKYFTVILHEENRSILKTTIKTISSVGFKLFKNDKEGEYSIYTFQKESPTSPYVNKIMEIVQNL
jgi:16S rRNA G966 N2-methylase RsmD